MATTTISNVRLFDGVNIGGETFVVIQNDKILSVGGSVPEDSKVIDASGMTLLPGLFDTHVHTKIEHLATAIRFGVTTELEMMGHWNPGQREEISSRTDVADVLSAEFGLTSPNGHPSELHARVGPKPGALTDGGHGEGRPLSSVGPGDKHKQQRFVAPTASTVEEAEQFVRDRLAEGADYIKIMIEEGSVLGEPGLPLLSDEAYTKAVSVAHEREKLVIAHSLTLEATLKALKFGVDGLAHLFIDKPHTSTVVKAIANQRVFVTPCLVLNASIMGEDIGTELAKDERVSNRLGAAWVKTLKGAFNTFPQGNFSDCLETVLALHKAGVDILVGTDASVPIPALGGLAHGASVHQEMELLVRAGLSPIEALRAATSVPARIFGLTDRGRIADGFRADLLLVEGDPTTQITDSLNIQGVWKKGIKLDV